jgi:Ca-activated chloride channel family protein
MVHVVGRVAFARHTGGICALIGLGALAIGCRSSAESSAPVEKTAPSLYPSESGGTGTRAKGEGAVEGFALKQSAADSQDPSRPATGIASPQRVMPRPAAGAPPAPQAQMFGLSGSVASGGAAGGFATARPSSVLDSAPRLLPRLDPNARYATTYRPGGAALAAFDAAVARGAIPASYKDLVGDFGARYAPALAQPANGGAMTFQVDTERAALAPSGGALNLRIAMRSSDAMPARAPLSVHLVLDVSGSMSGTAIDNARRAAETLVERLAPQDDFSMVTFSSDAQVLVADGPIGTRKATVLDRIHHVVAEGGTNISAGLDLGYRQAHTPSINAEAVKIVMLLSDGHANAGDTNAESLADRSARAFQDGVQTSSFGLGADFDAPLMSSIADRGAGGYYYLADSSQIAPALGRELDARIVPAAQAVEVRLRLRPDVAPVKVFGSHVLDGREAVQVRQQEIAADRNVKKHDGIGQDRQDDAAGGMRFFMPAFARDDRHAMMVTLMLPPGVGERAIGSVEVRYKDRLRMKNVTDEIPVKIRYAADEAASAATTNASVAATAQAFAAGDAILAAAASVDRGDRIEATRVLGERAELLKRAAEMLHEAKLTEDGLRLARLSHAVSGDGRVEDALPLAVLLRGSGYGYLR